MNSRVIFVFNFSFLFFQPNITSLFPQINLSEEADTVDDDPPTDEETAEEEGLSSATAAADDVTVLLRRRKPAARKGKKQGSKKKTNASSEGEVRAGHVYFDNGFLWVARLPYPFHCAFLRLYVTVSA